MLQRRINCRFRPDFPKTGGGEDIALCLDTVHDTGKPLYSVPSVQVLHPWWDDGQFSSWRFFSWTQGDGLLAIIYPQYRYWNWPNIVEMMLFICFFALLDVVTGFIGGNILETLRLWFLSSIICIGIELMMDVKHHLTVDVNTASAWTGENSLTRVLALMLSSVFKNHVELGHLWVHLKSGRFWAITSRFDWHVGTDANSIPHEQRAAKIRFALFVTAIAVVVGFL